MRHVLTFGVLVGCGLMLASQFQAVDSDLPDAVLVGLLGFALAGASVAGLVVWALAGPTRAKWRAAIVPLLVAVLTLPAMPAANVLAWSLFVRQHHAELNEFVEDLVSYGRIHDMSHGRRSTKLLNGRVVDRSDREIGRDLSGFPLLRSRLAADGISPARYTEFRERLERLGFIQVEVTDFHVALVNDGMLDNFAGILWVRPGGPIPVPGSRLLGTELVFLTPLHGGWHYFGTT